MVFLMLVSLACVSNDDTVANENSERDGGFSSYRDIPGVTAEDITAIEALRVANDHFIYAMTLSTEAFYGYDGEIGGFAAYFCEWLENLFDIPFHLEIHPWEVMLAGINNNHIDFTGDFTPSRERRETFHMTEPIANRMVDYFRIKDSPSFADIAMTRPLRYGFLAGSVTIGKVMPALNELDDYEVIYVGDYEGAYELLLGGTIDAFFGEETAAAAFDAYDYIEGRHFFPPTFSPIAMTTNNTALIPIISIVNKALLHGEAAYLAELHRRGYDEYLRQRLLASLTDEEREYIKNNPVIPFVSQYSNYPMSFYNENEHEWQGISFDLLREVERLTGLAFELAHEDEFIRWPFLLEIIDRGEASFVTDLIKTDVENGQYIWLDTMIASEYLTLVSEQKQRLIGLSEVRNYTVGMVRNTAPAETFSRWFPDHAYTVEYDDTQDALIGMRNGEVDLVMTSTANLFVMTNYLELTGFKANIVFTDTLQESTFGLRANETILRSIIDKALRFVDINAITDEWKNRSFDYRYQLLEAQRPYMFFAIFLSLTILTLVFFLWRKSSSTGKQLEILVRQRTAELEKKQQDMEILKEAAEIANHAKSEFLATLSHEIRTPMNSIMGFAELAQGSDSLAHIRTYCDKITDGGKWLVRIIDDILDISKIEAGKMNIASETFHLHEIISQCQTIATPAAKEKGLLLQISTDSTGGKMIQSDAVRLTQILVNLLSNAIKFTEHGVVKLSTTTTELTDTHAKILFEVQDDGIGMSKEQIEKVFEPYIQADSSTTRSYGGMGLGLAIVKNIVELMGSVLSVDSTIGSGSRFYFEIKFPVKDAPKVATDQATDSKPVFVGLVLVCDDNPLNQEVVLEHLTRVGLKAVTVENGKEGVDLVKERAANKEAPFDLIFMDIFMPVMDGMEAATQIHALGTGTPIVALTANLLTGEREKYARHGMPECLGKPFTTQELWQVLGKYLTPVCTAAVETRERSDDLLDKLQQNFVKYNRDIINDIHHAIATADTKLAHRLAHSLKGNAGLIEEQELRNAAEEVEVLLRRNILPLPADLLARLESELKKVIDKLGNIGNDTAEMSKSLDSEQSKDLLTKLSVMLDTLNPEAALLVDDLAAISGTEELVRQIEAFDFAKAAETIRKMKNDI
jgi:signal transduction histidine kinase/CheY-like chemotaxis protein/HPt (histidine-containing phosphotransfer) domain-containing protein